MWQNQQSLLTIYANHNFLLRWHVVEIMFPPDFFYQSYAMCYVQWFMYVSSAEKFN